MKSEQLRRRARTLSLGDCSMPVVTCPGTMSDRKYVAALYHVGDSEFVPYDATDIAAPDNETAIARARA
jgi:hypothetical protein